MIVDPIILFNLLGDDDPYDPNQEEEVQFSESDMSQYPIEHVQKCIKDKKFQKEIPLPDSLKKVDKHCDKCKNTKLLWYRFRSPPITWQHLCGVESWLLVCPKCMQQYDEVILKVN